MFPREGRVKTNGQKLQGDLCEPKDKIPKDESNKMVRAAS